MRDLLFAAVMWVSASGAHAGSGWSTTVDENPFFGERTTALVASADDRYAFGVACTLPNKTLSIFFVVPDQLGFAALLVANPAEFAVFSAQLELMMIVDSEARMRETIRLEAAGPAMIRAVIEGHLVDAMVRSLTAGKRRIAVALGAKPALQKLGVPEIVETATFTTSGIEAAVRKPVDVCH